MTPEQFFDLFIEELTYYKTNTSLEFDMGEINRYYHFLKDKRLFAFRKNYFLSRLNYIAKYINNPNEEIWDCGSGYGTTCLYLAMNGIKCFGTTLDSYYEVSLARKKWWDKFGDASLFTPCKEYFFDNPPPKESYDVVLAQDTLHHTEPLADTLKIINNSLRKYGRMVVIEMNGDCIIENIVNYIRRGK